MRPPWHARDLRLLPGGQRGVEIGQHLGRLRFELGDLVDDGRQIAARRQRLHLVDARIDVGDRLLETEIGTHENLR